MDVSTKTIGWALFDLSSRDLLELTHISPRPKPASDNKIEEMILKSELFIKNPEGDVEARPEVVLINSHDGTRPIQFEMGLFRLVCENGLVIKDQDMGSFRERHTKLNFQGVKDLISEKVDGLKNVVSKISQWNMKEMSDKERYNFAVEALALRLSTDRKPEQYKNLPKLLTFFHQNHI